MPIHPACHDAVRQHAGLVTRTALQIQRSLPAHLDLVDELVHVGNVAFLEAIQRFEWADENPTFVRFAFLRIRGAMYDSLREYDSVPHRVRARARRVSLLDAAHLAETGSSLTPDELAQQGVSHRAQSALADVREVVSLDAHQGAGDLVPDARPDPEAQASSQQIRKILQSAFHTLNRAESFVVLRYFDGGFTLLQIAAHLGCSESRVSQIKTAALRKLRTALEQAGITTAEACAAGLSE